MVGAVSAECVSEHVAAETLIRRFRIDRVQKEVKQVPRAFGLVGFFGPPQYRGPEVWEVEGFLGEVGPSLSEPLWALATSSRSHLSKVPGIYKV